MKRSTRNTVLGLLGLGSLLIYVLACTSFSPDDKRIVYPSVDRESGLVGIAVYDRAAGTSGMVLLPAAVEREATNAQPTLIRAQYLEDTGDIVALCALREANGSRVYCLPGNSKGPVKIFDLPEIEEDGGTLMLPLATAGHYLFLTGSNQVVRLDLRTGAVKRHRSGEERLSFLPAGTGDSVFYVTEGTTGTFGRMDANSFAQTPLIALTNEFSDGTFFAYNRPGTRIAFVTDPRTSVVADKAGPTFVRALDDKGKGDLTFGGGFLTPTEDRIVASFRRRDDRTTNTVYGVMEIPLSKAPVRETILVTTHDPASDEMYALYMAPAISHDAKTLAVASTYLACEDRTLKAQDCALFLVDLLDPNRKITRVPIPMPSVTGSLTRY